MTRVSDNSLVSLQFVARVSDNILVSLQFVARVSDNYIKYKDDNV